MKSKLLCILHRSPPMHGAAKVGDFIGESEKLKDNFDCKFITIKSSDSVGNIGKINFKKLYLVIELYIRVLIALIVFRPNKIYFTASVNGAAFYRDLLISTLCKLYKRLTSVEIFYHYHTKGVNKFVLRRKLNLYLTNFFLKNINIILLTPLLKSDFKKITTFKEVLFLPNGVENSYSDKEFEEYILKKNFKKINILYLSNMIKSKGYFKVLKLANTCKDEKFHFNFAGGWQKKEDEKEFFQYIKDNNLTDIVTYIGFVNGKEKKELFEQSHLLIFPTRYPLESFGLVIIEAFSYGLPVISTDEASIPYIIDVKSGIVIKNNDELDSAFYNALDNLINIDTSKYCRKRYLENFTLDKFEENLVRILK